MPPPPDLPRVLSVQSHVVSGYVGNKAAVLPLQLAGFDVDPLLSVHFSNHTGYPSVAGDRLGASSFAAILGGLEANGLLGGYDYVLTGYIGSAAVLGELGGALAKMKDAGAGGGGGARRGPVVVVDPVMGDHDRADPAAGTTGLYVAPDVPAAYRALLPLADVVTPNAFEAEALTGVAVTDVASAIAAAAALHAAGVATVVVTSVPDGADLTMIASSTTGGGGGGGGDGGAPPPPRVWRVSVPRLPGPFTGTGDLFAALLLVGLHTHGADVGAALAHAAGGVAGVCAVTADGAAAVGADATRKDAAAVRGRELRLVQCVDLLRGGGGAGVTAERVQ